MRRPGNPLVLTMVKLILDGMMAKESKKMELRADSEGCYYATTTRAQFGGH